MRNLYATDADRVCISTKRVYSFNLPMMPSSKNAFFISRPVTSNETFAPAGTRNLTCPSYCVTWHKALSKRNAENIASTLHKFIEVQTALAVKDIILYCDNFLPLTSSWLIIWDTIPNPGKIKIYTSGCPKNQNKCW